MAVTDLPSAPTGRGETNKAEPTVPTERDTPKINLSEFPTPEERRKVNQVTRLFSIARDYRRPMVQRWQENYRMLRNQYWDTTKRGWMPSPQIPEIWPIVDALVSWETDQGVEIEITPAALPHTDFANFFNTMGDNLQVVLDASYQVNHEEIEISKAQWSKYVYGTGFLKTTWDMTLAGGLGDAVIRFVPCQQIYPDPTATSTDDWNYVCEAKRMSVQDLDRRWPGTSKLFPMGGSDVDMDEAPTQLDGGGGVRPPRTNPAAINDSRGTPFAPPGSRGARSATDLEVPAVSVIECWIRETDSYSATDINTGKNTKKAFDKWRVMVVAGGRLIMDEPADNLWSHGSHPYDRLVVRDTGEFWGFSLVSLLTSSQKAYNRVLAAMQQNAELVGNPVWKDAGSWTRTQLTSKPGQRIPVGAGGARDSGYVQPPQMNQAHPFLLNHHIQRMETVSGLTAVMKGSGPGGRNAEGVIDALQEAGFVRIRSAQKFLEAALQNAFTKKADLTIENYTTPRMIAIAGPGGERTSITLKARHFMIPTKKGATPLRYQLLIDVGSRRHTSRAQREETATKLFTLNAIDRTALLEDMDYPNATVVAQRMDEHEKQMAAMGADTGKPGARQRARA